MGIETLVLGGLLGATGMVGAKVQSDAIKDTNDANRENQRFINAENERLTREAWQRDDNATQRRKADLIRAGLNPNLAAGSAANTTTPARMEPFHQQANTAMGEGVKGFGRDFATAFAIDASRAQTNLTKKQADTEDSKYMANISAAEKDLAQAQAIKDVTPSVKTRNYAGANVSTQEGKIKAQQAKEFGEGINPGSNDNIDKLRRTFPGAMGKIKEQLDDPSGMNRTARLLKKQGKLPPGVNLE